MTSIDLTLMDEQKINFIKIIEELRYVNDSCNKFKEELINLHQEKLKLEKFAEDLQTNLHKSESLTIDLQQEILKNRTANYHPEKGEDVEKIKLVLQASENTIASLKNKILNYNMCRVEQDKKLADSEHKLFLCKQDLNMVSERMNQLQLTVDKLNNKARQTNICNKTGELQDKLECNVKVANKINSDLAMSLKHKNCIIQMLETDKTNLKNRLIECQSKLKIQENQNTKNEELKREVVKQIAINTTLKESETKLNEDLNKANLDLEKLTMLTNNSTALLGKSKQQYVKDIEELNLKLNEANKQLLKDSKIQEDFNANDENLAENAFSNVEKIYGKEMGESESKKIKLED